MSTILPREMKTRSTVGSPIKDRFQPYYLKTRATAAATADFAMKSLRGQTAKELDPRGALMAKDVFIRGLTDLPDEMLREGARAQYATCERARHRVVLATWELEENMRWRNFLTRTLEHLRLNHQYSETDLEIWEQTCSDRGLQGLNEDNDFYQFAATQETLTSAVLQEQVHQLKRCVEERDIDNDEEAVSEVDLNGSNYEPSEYGSGADSGDNMRTPGSTKSASGSHVVRAFQDMSKEIRDFTNSFDRAMDVVQERTTQVASRKSRPVQAVVDPIPVRKQRAIIQLQKEGLEDHDTVEIIKHFQADVAIADSYLVIEKESIRKLFLSTYLK